MSEIVLHVVHEVEAIVCNSTEATQELTVSHGVGSARIYRYCNEVIYTTCRECEVEPYYSAI